MNDNSKNDQFLSELEDLCRRYGVHLSADLNGISALSKDGSVCVDLPSYFEGDTEY